MPSVLVVPYDPRWPALFRLEAERLAAIFSPFAEAIHHIGSTSVPGLASKPQLDIMVSVARLDETPIQALEDATIHQLSSTARKSADLPGNAQISKRW